MFHILIALGSRLRELRTPDQRDRGETGPLGYAVLVSAIVVLAVLVVGWGQDIASYFMQQVEEVDAPDVGQ